MFMLHTAGQHTICKLNSCEIFGAFKSLATPLAKENVSGPLESLGTPTGREATTYRQQSTARFKAAAGLADLALRRYKQAAKNFLQVRSGGQATNTFSVVLRDNINLYLRLQVSFDAYDYSELLAPRDIAVYGSLCALASFDRTELQKLVIANTGFKQVTITSTSCWGVILISEF